MRKPHLYKTGDICTKQVLSDETAGALLSKVRHATPVQNRVGRPKKRRPPENHQGKTKA